MKNAIVMFAALAAAAATAMAQRGHAVVPLSIPTFDREVVRIFQDNCQSCHHPGGIGPFSLMTYESAKPYAPQIRIKTHSLEMPPWKPVAGCGDFKNAMHLTTAQIDTIAKWVAAGAPEGNPADLPAPLHFADNAWYLGSPDMVLSMPGSFSRNTDDDLYRLIPLDHLFTEDTYIDGFEVRPGAPANVHHILIYTDASGESDRLDALDPDVGYPQEGGMPGFVPASFFGTWIGGQIPTRLPQGMAIKIPKNSKIVLEVHYHPHGGKIGPDKTVVGLHFSRDPIHKLVQYGSIDNANFVIPANDKNYRVSYSWTSDRPMHILSMGGHMHYLGQRFDVSMTPPGQPTTCLLNLANWDPAWQGLYEYQKQVAVPAGTRLDIEGFYDNSANNARQFNSPPIDVPYGGYAKYEMCFTYFTFTYDDEVVDVRPSRYGTANR